MGMLSIVSEAVSISTLVSRPVSLARKRRSISKPSISGSLRSRRISSGFSVAAMVRPCLPVVAFRALYPLIISMSSSESANSVESSIIRIFFGVMVSLLYPMLTIHGSGVLGGDKRVDCVAV